jgi:LacI family transcriptional regulator
MTTKRVTLADVAAEAGVSKTAVSFALNNTSGARLSEEVVDRVKAAAKKLNYRPNYAARTLRTQQTHSIGFLSTNVAVTRFAMAMISGALREADAQDHTLLIGETSAAIASKGVNAAKLKERAMAALLDRQIDGLIIADMGAKKVDAPQITPGTNMIFANLHGPDDYCSILPDEAAAGKEVVEALLAGKYRTNIMLIGASHKLETDASISATIGIRLDAIRRTLRANSVHNWTEIASDIWNPELGYKSILAAHKQGQMPDAIICLNDNIAFGVYQACSELGIKIGKDVSLVSFDDDEFSENLKPGLTTARLPYEVIGKLAVKEVLSESPVAGIRLVPMPIQHRDSVAK